jgi:acetyl-CoA acyltransferase 1
VLARLSLLASLTTRSTSKNADDIVITLAIRTPLTKARKGGFKDTSLEYLVYALLKEVRERSNIDPALVEDICLGNVRSSFHTELARPC